VTGTPEFFDTRRGVAGLQPLHDRIRFQGGRYVDLRQAQLELAPFDATRLRNVAVRLRELFPAEDRGRLMQRVSDEFLDLLVAKVTEGFKGDVGVVPRQFLRELVHQMDLVDQHADYEPMREYGFVLPDELPPEERAVLFGEGLEGDGRQGDAGGEPELVPQEDVW
jgi:hypothetical protein